MIALIVGLLAVASAAPYYGHHHDHFRFRGGPPGPPPPPHGHPEDWGTDNYFGQDVFDTRRFWEDLATEMHRFDAMLNDFTRHFPSSVATEGLEGDEYKVTITLVGFEEKDIVVKAREGVLMIQAIHKTEDGNERSYLDLRTLPTYVNVSGSWMYDKNVLKIVFPVTEKPKDVTDMVTEAPVSETTTNEEITTEGVAEDHSREEMATNNENTNQDADVGLDRGDKETELLTNVIPKADRVEATTYAVDLKGDVEFVPIKY